MRRLQLSPDIGDSLVPDDDLWRRDEAYARSGHAVVAGVDEAGRGALAGPVVAAAVVMPEGAEIPGIRDSKALDADRRRVLYREVRAFARAVGVGVIDPSIVDRINILRATHRAMAAALAGIDPPPDFALIDGLPVDGLGTPHESIVKGDKRNYVIAAASIVAKVTRDNMMIDLDALYPGYGFADHKGYGTASHRAAILRHGPCPIHRRSFEPVAEALRPTLPSLGDTS